MEVIIRDPKFAVSTLKHVYNILVYNITYWRDGQMDKVTENPQTQRKTSGPLSREQQTQHL